MELQKKNINIEFFDEEPIENVITCLNFKMDRTIFFGYKKTMTEERKHVTEKFLKSRCNVEKIYFHVVNACNLEQIVEKISEVVLEEQKQGNNCFFDLTGGEDLVLVAIGMLAERYQIPMHKYDVEKNLLIGLQKEGSLKINKTVPKQDIKLNLDDIIGMRGGCINYNKQKLYKDNLEEEEFRKDVLLMWDVAKKDAIKWNVFSSILKECSKYKTGKYTVTVLKDEWEKILAKKAEVITSGEVDNYFISLQKCGIMTWSKGKKIVYSYKNDIVKGCINDAGSLLELATYYNRKNRGIYSDIRVGVHLDWDGRISHWGKDVENEIDVMTLEGNIPTFISCKNGEISPTALYELDAITKEMGGKYAKKELVIGATIAQVQRERAKRMDIAVCDACGENL